MSRSARKTMAAMVIFSSAGVAYGYSCPPVIDQIWELGLETATDSVSAAVTSAYESISSARASNLERIQSALRVLTKQIQVSSDKMSTAELTSKQASAAFSSELADSKAVFETAMQYSPTTGQGYDPCGELTRTQKVAVALGEANSSMKDRVLKEIDAAPGRVVSNPSAVVAKRLSDAKTTYCTVDEAASGMCSSPGALAGKDRDAAHFFTSYPVGSPEANAKNAMVNHLFGLPPTGPTGPVATTPSGQAFYSTKRSYDTFRSIAQASFKAIQSWTESRTGAAGDSTQDSVLDAIGKKVATYSGGANYADWEKTLTAQSEHGLLVEYAKKRAFQLYLNNLQYQQFERTEALVAALTALRARELPVEREPLHVEAGARRVR